MRQTGSRSRYVGRPDHRSCSERLMQAIPKTDARVRLRGENGMFVRDGSDIEENEVLDVYLGWLGFVSEAEGAISMLDRKPFEMYALQTASQIDGESLVCSAHESLCVAKFCNDCRTDPFLLGSPLSKADAARENAHFVEVECNDLPYLFLVASRRLKSKEEVLLDYGGDYWRFMQTVRRRHEHISSKITALRRLTDGVVRELHAA